MNREYCNRIVKQIMRRAKSVTIDELTGVKFYERSAREIESWINLEYLITGKITHEEYYYIFGRICADALAVGGKDFFRL